MSGVVVVIGYILLIPSILGTLLSAFALIVSLTASASVGKDVGPAGAIVGGIFIMFGVASLVGGLLGWLLVMKKDILKCSHCGAVVAAS